MAVGRERMDEQIRHFKRRINRDFPGGPVVETLPSRAQGVSSIPGQGTKIPHASWPKNQNMKKTEVIL